MSPNSTRPKFLADDRYFWLCFALIKLILHFILNIGGGYGIFRDEFYYIACGNHLAFGYVDHPPFIALIAGLQTLFLGDSIFAIRFLPAVAGALAVYFTGNIARQLGGKRYAQALAMLAVITAPVYLAISGFLSMNPFDQLFWILGCLLFLKIIQTRRHFKFWLILGLVAGIGLENKISLLFWGFGLFIGIILTHNRKHLTRPGIWYAALIAILLLLPYLTWQAEHNWATIEFMNNAREYKITHLNPLQFFLSQIEMANPLAFMLMMLGLYYFMFDKEGGRFRIFGWMYLAVLILLTFAASKPYYFAPIFPLMFAGGAVFAEKLTTSIDKINLRKFIQISVVVLLILIGTLMAPFALPILPVETFIDYSEATGMEISAGENHEMGSLPQIFADMFGWEEFAAQIAEVYHSLPPADQAKCAIWGRNYGEAGAVDFYSEKYKIPKAISGHNSYWIWGPGNYTLEVLIVPGISEEDLKEIFESVEYRGEFRHKYVMPYENNLPIFVCRGLIPKLDELWEEVKNFN